MSPAFETPSPLPWQIPFATRVSSIRIAILEPVRRRLKARLSCKSITPMNFDSQLSTPKGIATSIVFVLSLFSAIPCTASGENERERALLLGYESMALFYNEVGEPLLSSQSSIASRLTISDYLRELELVGVSYPTTPIGTPDNPAALASYGQAVIDSLDDVPSDAFIVGWYGAIAMATNRANGDYSFPALVMCEHAQRAQFQSDLDCTSNSLTYYQSILETARLLIEEQ